MGTLSWHLVLQPSHLFSFQQVFLYFFGGITRHPGDADTCNFSSSQTQNSWEYRTGICGHAAGNVKKPDCNIREDFPKKNKKM